MGSNIQAGNACNHGMDSKPDFHVTHFPSLVVLSLRARCRHEHLRRICANSIDLLRTSVVVPDIAGDWASCNIRPRRRKGQKKS